jgi:hypothetical protein
MPYHPWKPAEESTTDWHFPKYSRKPPPDPAWFSTPVKTYDVDVFGFDGYPTPPLEAMAMPDDIVEVDSFNWDRLAVELKEIILNYCIRTKPTHRDIFHGNIGSKTFPSTRKYTSRTSCEPIQKLGPWKDLLSVNKQIRVLTLRLCFSGSIFFPNGYCVSSESLSQLRGCFYHLDNFHQITASEGIDCLIPKEDKNANPPPITQASLYRDYATIYPELNRFSTFKHGIRKIFIDFNFSDYMSFFKVTAGGLLCPSRKSTFNCDEFHQLPYLNQVIIALPDSAIRREKLWDTLFYPDRECPRTLLRLIYERIAEELAPIQNLKVVNFLDADEEQRFNDLRETARFALRFTPEDLKEIYADTEGGIAIDVPDSDSDCSGDLETATTDFWPPRCRCSTWCWNFFTGKEDPWIVADEQGERDEQDEEAWSEQVGCA